MKTKRQEKATSKQEDKIEQAIGDRTNTTSQEAVPA